MELYQLFRRAHSTLRQYVAITGWILLATQILATAVFPIAEATLRQQANIPAVVFIIVYGLHIIFAIIATYGLYKAKDFVRLASLDKIEQGVMATERTREELSVENQELLESIEELFSRSVALQGTLAVLQGLAEDLGNGTASREDVESLLSPLIKYRTQALGVKSDDLYNFAVYLYDVDSDRLQLFFRSCDDRIQRHDRSWGRGEGHTGIAFAQNRTIISGDISEYQEILHDGGYDTDAKYYTSFVSTPILNGSLEESIGVFVATSSRQGHFSEEHRAIFESLAIVLSIYFSEHDWKGTL